MTVHEKAYFRDENPGLFKTHPLQLIKGASTTAALVQKFEDSNDRAGAKRTVYYNDPDGDYEAKLELMLWEHTGADLTLLTNAIGTGEAVRAGNPEGRFIHADGTFGAVSAQDVNDIVGVAFSDYYLFQENRVVTDAAVATIEAGDWFWVIRKGVITIRAGEVVQATNTAVGDLLVTDVDTTGSEGGRVRAASAMGTPNAAEILENTAAKIVGMALAIEDTENALFLAKIDVESYGHEITDVTYA